MQVILSQGNQYILRLEKGEELVQKLAEFCSERVIKAAFFSGLGAFSEVVLSAYNPASKAYTDREFSEDLEIASLTGDISTFEGKIVVHAHGTFGDSKMSAYAGHVKKVIISATCEIYLQTVPGEITRKHSQEIGINLMDRHHD